MDTSHALLTCFTWFPHPILNNIHSHRVTFSPMLHVNITTIIITRQISLGELIDPHVNNKKTNAIVRAGGCFLHTVNRCVWPTGCPVRRQNTLCSRTQNKNYTCNMTKLHTMRESLWRNRWHGSPSTVAVPNICRRSQMTTDAAFCQVIAGVPFWLHWS